MKAKYNTARRMKRPKTSAAPISLNSGIEVTVLCSYGRLPVKFVKKISEFTLKKEKIRNALLTVLLTSDVFIKKLNNKYKSKDSATDVLSFDLKSPFAKNECLVADIVISIDMARATARNIRVDFKDELLRYAVHGILHLTGYDDSTFLKKKKMWERQEELLGDFKKSCL